MIKRVRELCLGDVITEVHGLPAAGAFTGRPPDPAASVTVIKLQCDGDNPEGTHIHISAQFQGGGEGSVMLIAREPVEVEEKPAEPGEGR